MATFKDIMKATLFQLGRGNFVTPELFENRVSKDFVASELVEMTRTRLLVHIARGLYFYPNKDENGKQILPSKLDIVNWFNNTYKDKALPDPKTSMYLLGLLNSNDLKFHTREKSKKLSLWPRGEILFKKSVKLSQTQYSSLEVYMVAAAMNHYGEAKIPKEIVIRLKDYLDSRSNETIVKDIETMPNWMKKKLENIQIE